MFLFAFLQSAFSPYAKENAKANAKRRFTVQVATPAHAAYAQQIVDEMEASAKVRGTGISKRSPAFIQEKMQEGKAVIALADDGTWAGFCYIESWTDGKYVVNSGLIVSPLFREYGLASRIKAKIFRLSRQKFPQAKIFGLTTTAAVMKINSELGYKPVPYTALTRDDQFWAGCQSCVNYQILQAKERSNCLCTGMLYDPAAHKSPVAKVASRVTQVLASVSTK